MQRAAPRARVLDANAEHTERHVQRAERERYAVDGHVAEQTRAPEPLPLRLGPGTGTDAGAASARLVDVAVEEEQPEEAVALRARNRPKPTGHHCTVQRSAVHFDRQTGYLKYAANFPRHAPMTYSSPLLMGYRRHDYIFA